MILLFILFFSSFSSVSALPKPVTEMIPVDGSTDHCPCCICLCAYLSNDTGDEIKFTFQSNYSGSWQNLEEERIVVSNATYCMCIPEFVWYNYTYYWRVAYNVGLGAQNSTIQSFTTAENESDCPCGEGIRGQMLEHNYGFSVIGIVGLLGVIIFLGYIGRKK